MPDTKPSEVLFADAAYEALEPGRTLAAKYTRLLKRLKLEDRVKGKRVGIKMHFGGNIGYSTIPPLFIRLLVQALREAGAVHVKAMDNNPADGLARGYTPEVLGCDMVSTFGADGSSTVREEIGFKTLDWAEFGTEALDCDFFIDLSHVKGHGACGFGGALKNIAMGCVNGPTRGALHQLEGGLLYDKDKCTFCLKCEEACTHDAIRPNRETREIGFFFHNCNFCQHCVMVCPTGAVVLDEHRFGDFSRGMSLVTARFLRHFAPENLLFLNVLLHITVYCDCWGMTTPALVPDIGVLASDDIVAIEHASLDLIRAEDLIDKGLPKGYVMHGTDGHLFEKIHGKDPYRMVRYLAEDYGGTCEYELRPVR